MLHGGSIGELGKRFSRAAVFSQEAAALGISCPFPGSLHFHSGYISTGERDAR